MTGASVDLLVIGAGAAGLVGARTAAVLGATVLLVERDRPGGDCLWTGCVPSKALLAAAGAAADARGAHRLGVRVGPVEVDFAAVRAHVGAAVAAIEPVDSPESLEAAGVRVRAGTVRFTGPRSAEVDGAGVDGAGVRFRHALIATGSDPVLPGIPGLAGAAPWTSDTVWDRTELPAQLVVLGGGTVGCELGQAFARLGSAISIVEAAPRVLPGEDPDASAAVAAALTADGVELHLGAPVTAVRDGAVELAGGATVPAGAILVALGRRPDTAGLDPAVAGVTVDAGGFVTVDAFLRTTNPRIRAAGDVTGHPQFTHVAGVHGSTAASNAVLGLRRRAVTAAIPRVTFTAPEVAAVGRAAGSPGTTAHTVVHRDLDRAITEGRTAGFTRIVLDRRGRVVGATVVGPRAGETLAELTLAVRRSLRAADLAGVVHPYPTWADGPWNAALADVRARLAAPAVRRATGALLATHRWLDTHRNPPRPPP